MTDIRRKVLGDLTFERLDTLSSVTIFRGEVPDQPPVLSTPAGPDPSGRVAKYVGLYTGAGSPVIEADVADFNTELLWSFTTICVAGYDADCAHLADQVHDLVYRWSPDLTEHPTLAAALAGYVFGRVKPPAGFDPGPVRREDRQGIPPRFVLPLLWQLPVTTS